MKVCPNCNYDNFNNVENCEGCGQPIRSIRPETFNIVDFTKKNSDLYAVIGIFLALFEYLINNSDSTVRAISLCPLFISAYLLFALISKGNNIVRSQHYEGTDNQYFNENSFEFWIFLSINVLFLIGLVWSAGSQYTLSICLLGAITIAFVAFGRRISNMRRLGDAATHERNLTAMSIWFNLIGIFLLELGWLVFQILLPSIKHPTDPTIFYFSLIIPLAILFFGIGTLLANMFIGGWMILTDAQRIIDTNIQFSWASLENEFAQYFQTFVRDRRMIIFFVVIVLLLVAEIFLIPMFRSYFPIS
jgi:hypothetical protein